MRVYAGERDPESGVGRAWVVHEPPRLDVAEVVEIIAELRSLSAVPPRDRARQRADVLARKEALVTQLAALEEAPPPVELVCRGDSSTGFGWGGQPGSDDLAWSLLRAELGEEPPSAVFRPFRCDVLDPLVDRWTFRLPADRVWTWIEANRDLVERELFEQLPTPSADDPDGLALAVATSDAAPEGSHLSEAAASEVVRACEEGWAAIREHHPELPNAVMVLGSGVERGRLVKLGHWWAGRWVADGQPRGEVLLAGEALHLKPDEVFEVLLHEAAHGLNAARGVRDTSRGGRYHNARFGAAAQEVGLDVSAMPPYGLARTVLSEAAKERYAAPIERLGDVMRIARQIERGTRVGIEGGQSSDGGGQDAKGDTDRSRGRALAECGCGRKLRVAPGVLAAGPIVCGLCQGEFAAPGVARQNPEAAPSDLAAVDDWYRRVGTYDQQPMPAADVHEAARRERLARTLLRADGTIRGPAVEIGGQELAAGDRVIAASDEPGTGLPAHTLGTVEAVDAERGSVDIDFATWGRLRVGVEDAVARVLRHDYTKLPPVEPVGGPPTGLDVDRSHEPNP